MFGASWSRETTWEQPADAYHLLGLPRNHGTNTFNNFGYTITPGPLRQQGQGCRGTTSAANWTNPNQNIPYCTWWHFGLDFDETCHNIGYNLQAAWTQNGVDPGYSPLYGFEVEDGILTPEPQKITIQNASGVDTVPIEMQVMILQPPEVNSFPLEDLNTSFFDSHPEWSPGL